MNAFRTADERPARPAADNGRAPPASAAGTEPAATSGQLVPIHTSKEHGMRTETLKGQWKQLKGKVKEKWGQLTDDDIQAVEGRRDYLIGRIQERYGIEKERAEEQVREFERQLH
jgi:uncharacterized protein YjbJ (UPF0337 family)